MSGCVGTSRLLATFCCFCLPCDVVPREGGVDGMTSSVHFVPNLDLFLFCLRCEVVCGAGAGGWVDGWAAVPIRLVPNVGHSLWFCLRCGLRCEAVWGVGEGGVDG